MTVLAEKRRFGLMSSDIKDLTIKEKADYFASLFPNDNLAVSFIVFNKNCQCVKVVKLVSVLALLRYVVWAGFRGAIDQILLKMCYSLETGDDKIYNISLARDFNLNILILNKSECKEKEEE